MSINPAGKLARMQNRKCPSCKGPLGDINKGWSVCEFCKSKSCVVCGKISVLGFRLSPTGKPLCPRHWSAFIRMKHDQLNMNWKSDIEIKEWLDSFQLETTLEMEKKLSAFDVVAESIVGGREIIMSDEQRKGLIDGLTDEQKEFIRSLKENESSTEE